MTTRFGTNDRLNLRAIDDFVAKELRWHARHLGIHIEQAVPLATTPDKGYTARAEAGVSVRKKPLGEGKINIILFRSGDGTGNTNDYALIGIPEHWNPRTKTSYAELFIPIGTGYGNTWVERATALQAMTLHHDGTGIEQYCWLSESPEEMRNIQLRLHKETAGDFLEGHPRPQRYAFTVDSAAMTTAAQPQPYGNPHAVIFNDRPTDKGTAFFKIGAFLAFPTDSVELRRLRQLLSRAVHTPRYDQHNYQETKTRSFV